MSTSGNYEWAHREATRRAGAMERHYTIYRRKGTEDHIIRDTGREGPDRYLWDIVKTVYYKTETRSTD